MHALVVTITNAPGDSGAAYTLTLPDGRQVVIGDADPGYWAIANAIDDAFDDAAEDQALAEAGEK